MIQYYRGVGVFIEKPRRTGYTAFAYDVCWRRRIAASQFND